MHWIDILIFSAYLIAMLGVGFYFSGKNKNSDDYFVGGRKLGSLHIGLSVVATDVGGGFSIGLGGLGFTMGLSGSWLLFTGLIGAWLSGVFLIPKVYDIAKKRKFLSFPQFLEYIFDKRVAFVAGILSAIGYLGFTSSQFLSGAKLVSATFSDLSLNTALIIMGSIAVIYTVFGGLKAVIFTDTIQWIVLMGGLIFIGLPVSYNAIGGLNAIKETLGPEFLNLGNITWQKILYWMFSIIPIWFIGMTLYQRIYASKDEKTAKKGWFIAGLFEYPIMAFVGVLLGLFARVAVENGILTGYTLENIEPEMGLPILLKTILPVGLLGIVLSSYFSAIMSTADSCLMASSGNILTDILKKHKSKNNLRYSQLLTLAIGIIAIFLALSMDNVLSLMLLSYSFMVSGMFIPVIASISLKKPSTPAALAAMLFGGSTTLILASFKNYAPSGLNPEIVGELISNITFNLAHPPFDLDPSIFGITISLVAYIFVHLLKQKTTNKPL